MIGVVIVIVFINFGVGFALGMYQGSIEAITEYKLEELRKR